ncbi:MAG: serine/threonine-protein kinase, partial [Anaerolineales bacterium]
MVEGRLQAHQGGTARNGGSSTPVEEAREFLQKRLALLWKIGFIFLALYYLLANFTQLIAGRQGIWGFIGEPRSQILLVEIGTAALAWLRCREGTRPVWLLRTVDALTLIAFGTLVSLQAWLHRASPSIVSSALIPVTYAVVARAVIVPGHAAWTACLSLAGHLPLTVVAAVLLSEPLLPATPATEDSSLSLFMVRVLICSALATVVSSIIHGLRRQVRQAQQLGQYRIESRIGQGGMGEVYRASHIMLRRPTAVKLLRPDLAGVESIARFEREVQLASQLTHPNTVAIYDYGRTPEGTFYYAMEYLEGLTLESLVRRHGPQPPARTIHILKQVCASLREAHARGLIHRDIKPANVILCERGGVHDVAKVVDFGLVKRVTSSSDARISAIHTNAGTPLYMAPEAIMG